jgi:predicted RNase H-like nuclease (RuvC/YqgF family)
MPTKQTNLRIPVGILEAIDARRDAENDRTAIIISLLTSALTGEYVKPKETTASIISKLTKTISSLERTIEQLRADIARQDRSPTISAPRCTDVRPKTNPDDWIEEEIEPDDNGIDEKIELGEMNFNEELGEKLTHTEFLARFGCCESNEWEVHFMNGEVFKLQAVLTNAVRVLETDGTLKLQSEAYVDFYQSTSDLRSSLEIEPVVSKVQCRSR